MAKIIRQRYRHHHGAKHPASKPTELGFGTIAVRWVNVLASAPAVRIDLEGAEPGAAPDRAATWTVRLDEAEGLQALGRLAMAYGFKLVKETA